MRITKVEEIHIQCVLLLSSWKSAQPNIPGSNNIYICEFQFNYIKSALCIECRAVGLF